MKRKQEKIQSPQKWLVNGVSESPISIDPFKRKKFGLPVVLTIKPGKCRAMATPAILDPKRKMATKIKNDMLKNIMSNGWDSTDSTITICRRIIPDAKKKSEPQPLDTGENDMDLNASNIDDEIMQGPVPHFYSSGSNVFCVLEPQCKFSFHGKLKIQVLYGSVEIYGTKLDKSNAPYEVYSSRDSNLISIETSASSSNAFDDTPLELEPDILENYKLQAGWAVLLLQNVENTMTSFLNKHAQHRLFPKLEIASNYSKTHTKRAEIVLQAKLYSNKSKRQTLDFENLKDVAKIISDEWNTKRNVRTILTGGKDVGKSTAMRYLVNRLLSTAEAVIVLDLDPGQAEFTPPGCVSLNIVKDPLLGSNFTHLRLPYYQYYVGGVDIMQCLPEYIKGIDQLVLKLNDYSKEHQLPIVINTMGFCKRIGWDIIKYVIQSFQPTNVIQIASPLPQNNFDQPLLAESITSQSKSRNFGSIPKLETEVKYQLNTVPARAAAKGDFAETWNIEPHLKREIVMLAYLSGIIERDAYSSFKSYDEDIPTINSVTPYELPFSAVKISLGRPVTSQVLSVMNGNIIALCGADFEGESGQEDDAYPQVLIRAPLATCYGFGILRGVDMEKKMLYINSPLPLSQLKHVNCLIGSVPVPCGLLQLNKFDMPYTGGECDLPTSRDPKRGYFRMRPHINIKYNKMMQ